ncbi:MAG: hypothetical protein D6753_14745 [Planctomycetota bacterium]|nr:MAG: hypothetical protein D6753_14745 [Planctomycetota bacterium]
MRMDRACLCLVLICRLAVHAGSSVAEDAVTFDLPAIVPAQEVVLSEVSLPMHRGKLVRLSLPVSTALAAGFTGRVTEYVVEIEAPNRTMQVVDFWPRNELVTTVAGNVTVEKSVQNEQSVGVSLLSTQSPQVKNGVNGEVAGKESVLTRYEQKPPVHQLTSSGTIQRASGVFFKFRAGPVGLADGMRDVAMLVVVPQQWRADLLEVRMRAVGTRHRASHELQTIGEARAWVSVYREGDWEAAAAAEHFAQSERHLRSVATAQQKKIEQQALPTVFHRIGAALDVVRPRIPSDFIAQVLFGPPSQYLEGSLHRLPVEVRVAVLDFWDARSTMIELATSGRLPTQAQPVAIDRLPQRAAF